MIPRGVDLEITEQRPPDQPLDDGSAGGSVVVPTRCAINGIDVLMPSGESIDIAASDDSMVTARFTVAVRNLRIHPEHRVVDTADPPEYSALAEQFGDPFQLSTHMRAYMNVAKAALFSGVLGS
ncbi:hypothetical protein [Mycolicibacterium sp. XJ1819]